MLETDLAISLVKYGVYRNMDAERAALRERGVAPALAALAAARFAALYAMGEGFDGAPDWCAVMRAEVAPPPLALRNVARRFGVDPRAAEIDTIIALWTALGTAEAIMETGGDIRLARDPVTALNGYGSSHRPRPWAVTFASSTASSSSERGYAAADGLRLSATAAMLNLGRREPVRGALEDVRSALGRLYGVAPGGTVVLAASGTDTELLALAITHLAEPVRPIRNILIAPEETGSGVPMAARGLHFAVDTALGHDVARAAPIDGFSADTELATVPLRDTAGEVRPAAEVAADVAALVENGIASGRRVILHALDLSKTGLLAPSLDCLCRLRAAFGTQNLDIVVDACQARLAPASVQKYLALDAVVLVTGSKFFTGPPFAGAALIPPAIAARFSRGWLPAGLDAYFGRDEFPEICSAAQNLPPSGNYGLALRWHAALAEMTAFFAVPPAERMAILNRFSEVVRAEVLSNAALALLPAPPLARDADDEDWDRCPSIFSFTLARGGRKLTPDEARAVYRWLNADLSAVLPYADPALASRICHIGQPVKLPSPGGGAMGVLRVSAGARLISGEPSHRGLDATARLAREFADLRVVFAKIALCLDHFEALAASDPQPRYRFLTHTH